MTLIFQTALSLPARRDNESFKTGLSKVGYQRTERLISDGNTL